MPRPRRRRTADTQSTGGPCGRTVAAPRCRTTRHESRVHHPGRLGRPDRLGGIGMEGDKAFTARLARGDSQSRGAIGVGVEAIQLQAADLVAACSAPAGNHQGGPLKWVGKLVDRGHQLCQFMIGNETWHSPRHLRQVPSPEQRSGRTIGPAPTDDVGAKHRYRREHAAFGDCRQRSTGLPGAQWMTTSTAGGPLEVGGECRRVIAGDVCPLMIWGSRWVTNSMNRRRPNSSLITVDGRASSLRASRYRDTTSSIPVGPSRRRA